ncbi:MAG: hypothetical protein AABX33_06635 [Nanoarchaeota archaeon]
MAILSIFVFFVITFGLGYLCTRFVNESENFLERNLMRIGIGLGAFIPFGLLLNILRIPLDWRIFVSIGIIAVFLALYKNWEFFASLKNISLRLTKTDVVIFLMLAIFIASFYIYAKGAFSYPWLEDDDPWAHAIGAKYVSVEKTLFTSQRIKYIDPYPPSYDMIFGIMHQTNESLYWTLKFFNALLISLSIIFFFFFAKELTNKNKALFSAFALASAPAYLSHFIWAIALTIPLYFVSFYAIERIKHDKKWAFVAAIMIGATLVGSPSHSTYFALLFVIYYVFKAIIERSFLVYHFAAGFLGAFLSFMLWWLPALIRRGYEGTLRGIGLGANIGRIASVAGTGDKVYTLQDFFIAQKTSAINNPVGIGLFLSLLLVISLIALTLRYYNEIKKNKLIIFAAFFAASTLILFFLHQTYIKNITSRETGYAAPLEPGSVPFFEFLADQTLLAAGLLVMSFVFVSLIIINYKNGDFKDRAAIIVLAWLIFTFYAVNAGPYLYKLSPFRAWSILAIPLAILASEGLWFLMNLLKGLMIPRFLVTLLVVIGIIFTSAYQKYTINTSQWPPGAFWTSGEELQGYLWLKDNVEPNAKVFTFVNDGPLIGMDKFVCAWCEEIKDFKKSGVNKSAYETSAFLKTKNYKYLVIDGQFADKYGVNETNSKVIELQKSGLFRTIHATAGFILLEAN